MSEGRTAGRRTNDPAALDALRERHAPQEERFDQLVDESVYPLAAKYVKLHREDFVR